MASEGRERQIKEHLKLFMTWNGGAGSQRLLWNLDSDIRWWLDGGIIMSFRYTAGNQRIVSREIRVIDPAHESLN